MTDAGFFRGTSADQDNRFTDKEKKLLKQLKFSDSLNQKVDTKKVNLTLIKPWIQREITNSLGLDDDVIYDYVSNQLEDTRFPDGRKMQINMTGFLDGKRAREFMEKLWTLLLDAQSTPDGIPKLLVEQKKEEMKKREEEKAKVNSASNGHHRRSKSRSPEPSNVSNRRASPRHSTRSRSRSVSPAREKSNGSSHHQNNRKRSPIPNRRGPRTPSSSRSRSPAPYRRNAAPFRGERGRGRGGPRNRFSPRRRYSRSASKSPPRNRDDGDSRRYPVHQRSTSRSPSRSPHRNLAPRSPHRPIYIDHRRRRTPPPSRFGRSPPSRMERSPPRRFGGRSPVGRFDQRSPIGRRDNRRPLSPSPSYQQHQAHHSLPSSSRNRQQEDEERFVN